ncbi:MAG: CheR family methyltransferase [Archaeoglobaceae archaeon]
MGDTDKNEKKENKVKEGKKSQKKKVRNAQSIPVVGIGASAGGLKAIEKFFTNMPETDSGISFVLVQHLDPKHKSVLTDLIKRYTEMAVYEGSEGKTVKPNTVYIIPPNRNITLRNGKLHLTESDRKRGLWMPIDHFFRSLAEDKERQAICIIFSGTGTDGTLGLKEIKGAGGMAMAQDPKSADYDGMPRSAINTGMIDYVLSPEKMPEQLISYVDHAFGKIAPSIVKEEAIDPTNIDEIFNLLYNRTGHDFSHYKRKTILRRIGRRMALNSIEKIDRYVHYLQKNHLEIDYLFKELLITVTSFFRDPEAFEVLREQAIVPLLRNIDPDDSVRIWVPGCATGEEAYSIAILVQETMESVQKNVNVQVFATDIDKESIEKARNGIYPDNIVADVSTERLDRFFKRGDNTYQVNKSIRDMVVFAIQNVLEEPPFSNMDLISCRNLLIYMGQEPQKKLIPLFHYSLKHDGYLFLGTSESIDGFTDLFETVNRKMKLFKSKKITKKLPEGFSWIAHPSQKAPGVDVRPNGMTAPKRDTNIAEVVKNTLLEHHTPPSAIINKEGEILYIHGNTGKYLRPAEGEASLNIMSMARDGLEEALTIAVHKVVNQNIPVSYPNVKVKSNGETNTVNLEVKPVQRTKDTEDLIMVVFNDVTPPEGEEIKGSEEIITDKDQRIKELEHELSSKEEYLQTIIEELQTSNEELQSTNEELQSSNEELQSTNEELETSQEELKSVNEELETVNQEHQETIEDLKNANSDIKNLLNSIKVGTILVDRELTIKRFTSTTKEALNLIESDIGRPIKDISTNLKDDNMIQDIREVLDSLIPKETEAQTENGNWFLVRVLPYHTINDVIEGVVVTFIDITQRKQVEEELRRLATVVKDSNDAITVHDFTGNITHWNWGAEKMYGYSENEALKMNIKELVPEEKRKEAFKYIEKVKRGEPVESFETQRVTKEGRIIDVWLTATELVDDDGESIAVSTTERDITERKKTERELSLLATALYNARDAITIQYLDGTITEWNRGAEKMYGYTRKEVLGKSIAQLVPHEKQGEHQKFLAQIKANKLIERRRTKRLTKNGSVIEVELTVSPIRDEEGNLMSIATIERVVN